MKLFSCLLAGILMAGCGKAPSTTELDADLKIVTVDLEEARIDAAALSENKLAGAFAHERVEIFRNSKAMLEQKRSSFLRGIRISYTVDGKTYQRPSDWEAQMKALDEEIIEAKGKMKAVKSDSMGGLFGALTAVTGSMVAVNVGMLEHKRLLLKHDIPAYALLANADKPSKDSLPSRPAVVSRAVASASSKASPPSAPMAPKGPAEIELVSFERKHLEKDYDLNRYSPIVVLTLNIRNKTAKTIKAWRARLVAKNAFDKTILETNIESNDSSIAPGDAEDASFRWEDNQFDHDQPYDKIMVTSDENLKLELRDVVVVAK